MAPGRPFSLMQSSMNIDDGESSPTESDFEDVDSLSGDDEPEPVHSADSDYWLGIRIFQMLLARQVIESPSGANLDFLLGQRMSSCSYEELYDHLSIRYLRHPTDESLEEPHRFRSFVTLLGSVLRERGLDVCSELDSLIRNGHASPTNDLNLSDAQRTDPLLNVDMPADETAATSQLFKYSVRLKELGDREGEAPVWNENAQCDRPSLFRCTLLFRGVLYEAFGTGKKAAKHHVSRRVCHAIGLEL